MSLTPGARLGPYEIVSPLGVGGMGEVYKARDTRLDRAVAIKVLSPHLAQDEAFRARFDREAKAISQLSHPHICGLHDVGHQDDVHFLVLEYLEGETLATRIERGAIPADQAIRIAVEICDALNKAHRNGVTHRDLKPGNVMLTKTGSKLLDFGLAKSSSPGADGMTMAAPITAQGSILGTFQYMAPEQLEGQEADARSDIWALGCTLYEMVTGRPAFAGKTQASLIGAILKDEPARMSTVQPLAPAALDRVVMACLAKDPDARWQSAADIARELAWVATVPSDPAPPSFVATTGRRHERLAWMAAMAVVITVAGLGVWRSRTPPVSDGGSVLRAKLPLAGALAIGSNGHAAVAVSPDGRYIAYNAGAPAQLYLRKLDETESRAIDGTVGALYPFFSPNSASLGFLLGGSIKRIALGGGAPVPMLADLDVNTTRGVAWGDDDWIYYTPNYSDGLWRVRSSGGAPEQLTTPDFAQGEKSHRYPFVLPGSQAVLFVVATSQATSFDDARIEVFSLATRTRRRLIDGGTYPQYVSTGHLLYTRAGWLTAVPFDRERLTVDVSSAATVADRMFVDTVSGSGNYGVSRDGIFVRVVGGTAAMAQTLVAVDQHGAALPVRAEAGLFPTGLTSPGRLSRSGKSLAVYALGATSQVAVLDLERGTSALLTDRWDNISPVWVFDDSRIAFSSNRGGGVNNLWWQRSDGSGEAERLTKSTHRQAAYSWSPGARVLAFTDNDPNSGSDIWTFSIDDRKAQPLVKTSAEETAPAFSPDGHWIAYQSNRTSRPEVYVQAFPATGGASIVSNAGGGTQPIWRGDHEIVYRRGESVMSVQIATAPTFRAGEPVERFRTPNILIDLLPDGRLLMATAKLAPPVTELEIVANWFQELRKKLAGGL